MSSAGSFVPSLAARPRLLALLFGLIGATAYPPLAWWPLGIAAVAGLVLLVREAGSWRRAATIGWLFGFAHLTLANNWIATAFTHQAKMPTFLGWVAVPLLCLYLALYPALAALGAHLLDRLAGRRMPLAAYAAGFAACWIAAEWLRSWVFTGYPWPPLGLMLLGDFARPGLARLLPWLGTYGLSGLVVVLAGGLAALLQRRQWPGAGALAATIAAGMLWPAPAPVDGSLAFTLVQPNLSQADLNDGTRYDANFRKLAALSPRIARNGDGPRLVLWPEGVVPDYLETGYPDRYYAANMGADPLIARRVLAATVGPGSVLLAGTQDLEFADGAVAGARNSVTAIAPGGARVGSYDKAHLVPYGEYLALRWLLAPLGAQRLVAGSIDFWPGPGPRTLPLGQWGRAGVQICYEIVFSGQVVDRAERPDYIFNPSNDGWFGAWGPPQHLAQARLRALEEGLPVLRATTTGISAVIDPRGVVRDYLAPGIAGRIDGRVPPAAAPTLFARLGNVLPLGWAVVLGLISLVATRLRRR